MLISFRQAASSWIFFPSTGRIRKIGASSRSGSVQGVGGDFSYDDLGGGSWEDDYEWTVLSENSSSWDLEGIRKNIDAAYDAVLMTVDKTSIKPISCTFSHSSEGGYFKRLDFKDYKFFSGRLTASLMVMRNLKTGSTTEIWLLDTAFDIPLDGKLFDPGRFNQ